MTEVDVTTLTGRLRDELGSPRPTSESAIDESFARVWQTTTASIEESFERAGYYHHDVSPYGPPTTPWTDIPPTDGPDVAMERQLWTVRFNPKPQEGETPDTSTQFDVDDPGDFDWADPPNAESYGWRIDTEWSSSRGSLSAVQPGDLVVVQRTDPGAAFRKTGDKHQGTVLLGLCGVLHVLTYSDMHATKPGVRRSACLLPLARFTRPVPVATAKTLGRLSGDSFSKPRQMPGRRGGVSHHLAPVEGEDVSDLLSVCGVSPEVLAEPSLAVIAARLAVTETGNEEYFGLRYDHVIRNNVRRLHERMACDAARAWADLQPYTYLGTAELEKLAGYDLLFEDERGHHVQVEVKGYRSTRLADVHIQPSQYLRAEEASKGVPPRWLLYALLGAGTNHALSDVTLTAAEALDHVRRSQLAVKGGMKAVAVLRDRRRALSSAPV